MTIPLDILVTALVVAAVIAFWQLLDLVFDALRPHLDRWLWRRLGGDGEPPE